MIVGSVHGLGQWLAESGDWEVEDAVEFAMSFMWLGLVGLRAGRRWQPPARGRRRRSDGETTDP